MSFNKFRKNPKLKIIIKEEITAEMTKSKMAVPAVTLRADILLCFIMELKSALHMPSPKHILNMASHTFIISNNPYSAGDRNLVYTGIRNNDATVELNIPNPKKKEWRRIRFISSINFAILV